MIENKGGAGGYIAWQMVAASPNDGYTVLVAENALGINQALFKKHPSGFNPLKDYDAVGAMASTALAWTVANNVPANTWPEFVAWSKTVPESSTTATPDPAACRTSCPRSFSTAPGWKPFPWPSGAAGRPHKRSPADTSPWSRLRSGRQDPDEGKLVKNLFVTGAKRSPLCRTCRR